MTQQKTWTKLGSHGFPPRYLVTTLLGFAFSGLLLAGIIIRLRTREGLLVVQMSETDVDVEIFNDEGRLEIVRKGDAKMEIAIDPGKHRLRLRRDGTEIFAREFSIASGGKEVIMAKLAASPQITPSWIEDFDRDIVEETGTDLVKSGCANGVKYYESAALGNGWLVFNHNNFTDGAIEVTARIPAGYQNAWIFSMTDLKKLHGATLAVFSDGRVVVGPGMFDPEPPVQQIQRFLNHSAIKHAGEWNTFRIVPLGRQFIIYCNDEEILNIEDLGFEMEAGPFALGYSRNDGKARVEFERYILWPTKDVSQLPSMSETYKRLQAKNPGH